MHCFATRRAARISRVTMSQGASPLAILFDCPIFKNPGRSNFGRANAEPTSCQRAAYAVLMRFLSISEKK